jgi:hypothetical protein
MLQELDISEIECVGGEASPKPPAKTLNLPPVDVDWDVFQWAPRAMN